jgi:hypothetical protein
MQVENETGLTGTDRDYSSVAANVIDIWKANASRFDIVAPDIYGVDFPEIVDIYDRPDNPVFVPETGFSLSYAPYVLTKLAAHNGLGFAPFGVDQEYDGSKLTQNSKHSPLAQAVRTGYFNDAARLTRKHGGAAIFRQISN